MGIKIFPYSLVRYAGMDHRTFEAFKLKGSTELLQKNQHIIREKARLKLLLCDGLYDLITTQTDDRFRQRLINLKRQVYNDKKITSQDLEGTTPLFPVELALQLKSYLFLEQSIANFHMANQSDFQHQLLGQYLKLQELASDPSLQNGLLLSSPVLLEQLSGYLKKEPNSFRQKEHRIGFSLLRYLTRMCFKTSPFSTFTYTGIMQLSAEQQAGSKIGVQTIPKTPFKTIKNSVRLNNGLFEYLKTILIHHPRINELMLIRLNKTAIIKDDKIHFLINANNIESLQQLPAKGLQLLVFQLLKDNRPSIRLRQLLDQLLESVAEADLPAIKTYLFKLIASGLLETGMKTSGINPKWDDELLQYFREMDSTDPDISRLIDLFEQLQQYKSSYPAENAAKRRLILENAEQLVNEVLSQLQASAGLTPPSNTTEITLPADTADIAVPADTTELSQTPKSLQAFETINFKAHRFSGRQLFYEDCYTPEEELLQEAPIQEFIKKTDQLLNHLIPLDLYKNERRKMTLFFQEHYPEQAQVKVVDFYHAYYLNVKKPEKEKAATAPPSTAVQSDWEKAVGLKLAALTTDKPNFINLDHHFFEPLSGPAVEHHYSRGLFVQFYHQKETPSQVGQKSVVGVINSVLPGMGKVSGRFLSLFPAKVSTAFLSHNARLHPEIIKAELNDASSFNANIHPPLLEYELALPGGNNSYPENQQIQIADLTVSFDEKTDFLRLNYGEKQVYTYDLSLESFYNRSNLYQLLAHFNEEEKLFLPPLIHLVDLQYLNPEKEQEEEICSLPRITYENTVIIRRKTWRVETGSIPLQQASESDYDYFIRINEWRFMHGLPVNIFLFLRKRSFVVKADVQKKGKKEGLGDDYKPQFISFEQPLLIDLFKRLLSRAGDYLILEEMLPELPPAKTEEPVKEYLLQWYND